MAVKKVCGQLFSENVFAVSQLMNYSLVWENELFL